MAILSGDDNFFDAPKLNTGVALGGQCAPLHSQVRTVVHNGVLLDPHTVSGVVPDLSIDVFREVHDGEVGDVVNGTTAADVFVVEVDRTIRISQCDPQEVSLRPSADVAHIEAYDYRVVIQCDPRVILEQIVGVGVLAGKRIIGACDGGALRTGEPSERHAGRVGQILRDEGALGEERAGRAGGPVGIQVEDVISADHASGCGFVEAGGLEVDAGGGAEVLQGWCCQEEQQDEQRQVVAHSGINYFTIK